MKIASSGRALAVLAAIGALGSLVATGSTAKSLAPKGPTPDITVRVEGLGSTLLAPTTVTLTASSVTKDGTATDSCSGLSALGALQDATKGDWDGSWSKSYASYFITSIKGTSYPESADYYWAFWLDDKPAATGACGVDPAKGSSILFFPEYDGKSKTVVLPSVLGVSAPASALVGKPFTVLVTSYANQTGKPTPAAGATLTAGSARATVTHAGQATLTISRPGNVVIDASAPHTVRDETTICVHKPGETCRS
ncbi:MAG: DUF4430 domain-containing protein [Solirubrobacteraceae bacterium]|jgi:hypothetical protein